MGKYSNEKMKRIFLIIGIIGFILMIISASGIIYYL